MASIPLKDIVGAVNSTVTSADKVVNTIFDIFKYLQKTAQDLNISHKDLDSRIDNLHKALTDEKGKVTDGDILGAISGVLGTIGNTAAAVNPAFGISIGLVAAGVAGAASLLKHTSIVQNIVDTSLGIFNNIINSLESQGVDFSNSLINPDELPLSLQQLWKEITGEYIDRIRGNAENNIIAGERGDDTLYGRSGNDIIMGGTGQDVLYGGDDNDMLFGGQGWDTLDGGRGNDFLNGGNGRDILRGGIGNDTYFFKKNDGVDTIKDMPLINYSGKDGGFDTIKFDESVKKEDITFVKSAGNLSIKYGDGDSGTITVFGQFNDDRRAIEKIELASGEFITKDQIAKVTQDLNAYGRDHWIIANHHNIQKNADMMNIVMNSWQNA
ncbi:calcium-binding protein [Campylobacter sputorum]|uniref:calcium-binding protein n=1 Tax=Campylobacter sputorum TaxID=206 RepID=UPI00053BFE7A|nr:calcium-binding protein [Campylobacter sputorum]